MDHLHEKTIAAETIFNGKIINVHVEEVELPNGKIAKREIVRHPGAVAVIALTKEGKLVLVRQFRKPLERTIYEIPAGKLETNEDPTVCAKRELEEETQYSAATLTYLTSFYTSPGFADEIIHIYFTDSIEKAEHGLAPDEDEFVEVIEVTVEEANKLIKEQKIYDAKTMYAVMYLQLLEATKK